MRTSTQIAKALSPFAMFVVVQYVVSARGMSVTHGMKLTLAKLTFDNATLQGIEL